MKRPQSLREPSDRRISPRVRTQVRATLLDREGRRLADCVVRDLSEGGARLVFKASPQLPPEFVLRQASAKERRVRLVWTGDCEVGVAFLGAAETT